MISKLNIGKSIGCYSNLRKADILSISSHPCQYKTFLRNLTTEQIWFSAQGTYLLLVSQGRMLIQNKVLISFLRNSKMFETKLWWLLEKKQYEGKMEVLSLNLSWLKRPAKQSSQILRQNHLFEGTVHSGEHNSWDTEMKTTVFVMTLYVSN